MSKKDDFKGIPAWTGSVEPATWYRTKGADKTERSVKVWMDPYIMPAAYIREYKGRVVLKDGRDVRIVHRYITSGKYTGCTFVHPEGDTERADRLMAS